MLVLHAALPVVQLLVSPWNLLGLLPIALGIAVDLLAVFQFGVKRTAFLPGHTPRVLVTDGLFRYSRNPMYLGFVLMLIGFAMLLGSLTPMLLIPVFVVIVERAYIRPDEGILRNTFGAAWETYTRHTRRWL
jgi:protein-S-isoprenylcysteine O-methyltransferase Ste14